ncbi:hypothetical protein PY257_12200 [Ramlibacter sp. H39-3-26]|uniref:hypothetical protein n=1 Tax=Curvibacter soli TaxID=3031331 RepID=UPI0023DA259C|nr:hypothetical protein [Ramlibacter sp. H39-3-26]MDF1485933.1 hypothetical protein [Ramlibacter sp. H39-3-26]
MPLPPVDRLPNWRPQGADLYSTGASGAVPVRPVNAANSVESTDRNGEGVVLRTSAGEAAGSAPNAPDLPELYSRRGLPSGSLAPAAAAQTPGAAAPAAATAFTPATAAVSAAGAAAAGTDAATAAADPAQATDKTAARTGEAVNQPSNTDPANEDWTSRAAEQRKAEAAKQAAEPPKEPISKQLLEFLQSVWRASGNAIDIAQHTSQSASRDINAQQPLRSDPLTYTGQQSGKKSSGVL